MRHHTMASIFGRTKQPTHQEPGSKKEDTESGLSRTLLKVIPLMTQEPLYLIAKDSTSSLNASLFTNS